MPDATDSLHGPAGTETRATGKTHPSSAAVIQIAVSFVLSLMHAFRRFFQMTIKARFSALGAVVALLLSAAPGAGTALAQQSLLQSVAELVRVRDDVYAFRYLGHVAVFVPTDEGVVLMDPIGGGGNPQAPVALKAAIASITDQPVRWMIYSHSAADHSTGGAVFADTATFVSHVNAKPRIEARNDPNTPVPTVTVEQMMPIDAGGKHFELHGSAVTPQDDYLIFYYPAQKLIMTVDQARVRTIAFGQLQSTPPDRMVEWLDWVDKTFDFDTFLSGHGPQDRIMGDRQDLRDHRQYYIDLMAAVRDAQTAGHANDSEEMVNAVRTDLQPKYGTWNAFQSGLAGNITGVLRWWSQ
jgi:glyoxylase-like metal-dependent hydrolase (beta-lactamase superfamily II)